MRVLVVHDYAARYGGGEHMAFNLRDGLRNRGHAVRVFASDAVQVPGVPVEADATCFGTFSPLNRVTQALNPMAARALAREINAHPPSVIHVRMFLSQLSPLILPVLERAKRRHGTRCVLHVVAPGPICPIGTKVLPDGSACRFRPGAACHAAGCLPWAGVVRTWVQHGLLRRWLGVFDRIVANSASMADRLRADGLRCEGHVWNGVPDAPPRGPLGEVPLVCFAGRLVPSKGADVLIRAMPEVRRVVPEARLSIAGDGPERAPLETLAGGLGLHDAVDFAGHVDHARLHRLTDGAWATAVPSLWEEPFGIACAEAMLRGTAVVASASGGLVEQVVDGHTGYLAAPGDADAWAAALARLLGDRALAERLGRAGRERALECFTLDRFIESFLELYAELGAA